MVADAPPPESPPPVEPDDANGTSRPDEEEEQPYWASFEEDKSIPSEEEFRKIERQPTGPNALDRKFYRSLHVERVLTAFILHQTTTGKSWHLSRLTTPSTSLQQQGASHGL